MSRIPEIIADHIPDDLEAELERFMDGMSPEHHEEDVVSAQSPPDETSGHITLPALIAVDLFNWSRPDFLPESPPMPIAPADSSFAVPSVRSEPPDTTEQKIKPHCQRPIPYGPPAGNPRRPLDESERMIAITVARTHINATETWITSPRAAISEVREKCVARWNLAVSFAFGNNPQWPSTLLYYFGPSFVRRAHLVAVDLRRLPDRQFTRTRPHLSLDIVGIHVVNVDASQQAIFLFPLCYFVPFCRHGLDRLPVGVLFSFRNEFRGFGARIEDFATEDPNRQAPVVAFAFHPLETGDRNYGPPPPPPGAIKCQASIPRLRRIAPRRRRAPIAYGAPRIAVCHSPLPALNRNRCTIGWIRVALDPIGGTFLRPLRRHIDLLINFPREQCAGDGSYTDEYAN